MEVYVGYKKAGIMTANEIREKLWLLNVEWGDKLTTDNTRQEIAEEILKKEKENFTQILKSVEDDLYENL
jgi:hypothetical protein